MYTLCNVLRMQLDELLHKIRVAKQQQKRKIRIQNKRGPTQERRERNPLHIVEGNSKDHSHAAGLEDS